jgi:hypothetical protein
VVSVTLQPYFTPGKDPVPIVQEAGWAPGPVWTGAENPAPTGIRSPDRPARSSVAIPTELPGPLKMYVRSIITGFANCSNRLAGKLQLNIYCIFDTHSAGHSLTTMTPALQLPSSCSFQQCNTAR